MKTMTAPLLLRGIWTYRGFVLGSVRREFHARYGQAVLGALWSVLSPLAMIAVYTLIFTEVMRTRLPGSANAHAYSIYLCAGILTWGLFADIVTRAQSMFIDQASLLKKVRFPRLCLPVIVVLNALLHFAISFALFLLFLIVSGNFPGPVMAALLPVLVLQLAFAGGLGLIAGVLNVFFRDIGQFLTILLQFWFWLTPIVYPPTILPPALREAMAFNPMAAIIGAYQAVLVQGRPPDWPSLLLPLALALALCLLGLRLFRKRAPDMVDEL